jgi:hypothetical protein
VQIQSSNLSSYSAHPRTFLQNALMLPPAAYIIRIQTANAVFAGKFTKH